MRKHSLRCSWPLLRFALVVCGFTIAIALPLRGLVVPLQAVLPPPPRPLKPASPPDKDSVLSGTRQVSGITIAPDGAVWVATSGGVLRRGKDGVWQKFTRLDGLPAHEVRSIRINGSEIVAVTPHGEAIWRDEKWAAQPVAASTNDQADIGSTAVTWRGTIYRAALAGLRVGTEASSPLIPLPPSKGTHISALLPHGDQLWAALFGDGLWSFDGKSWQSVAIDLPEQAREITALGSNDKTLWVGTRRNGLWKNDGKKWTQYLQPDEPFDHNAQALINYRGVLLMSTLEDGLAARTGDGWKHFTDDVTPNLSLSSNAPRQMVEFKGNLYARHGGGKIDRFDGAVWTRAVFPFLPRKKALALAADNQRLCVAQWGGWSEWDGKVWKHYLNLPQLQGLPIVTVYPNGSTLWLGTQSRGVGEFDYTTNKLRWHDERHGLPDDWITCLAHTGSTLYAGTFVGGLTWWDGRKWTTAPQLKGENVTALEPDGAGGLFIATRNGVWHRSPQAVLQRLNDDVKFLDTEAQALCKVPEGLWIGARTGLFFVANPTLREP